MEFNLRGTLVILFFAFLSQIYVGVHAGAELVPNSEVYAVLMNNYPPTAAYMGGISDLPPRTSPATGERLDTGAPHVQAYMAHLVASHDAVLASVNVDTSRKLYSYTHTLNAFAVSLTPTELAAVSSHPQVGRVEKNKRYFKETTHTPDFLNIPDSLWSQTGGKESAGEGIIVGIIDTGINPDHPSFADDFGAPYADIHGVRPWRGSCTLADKAFHCNNKLIGAKFYVAGLLAGGDEVDTHTDSYSPRDVNGHGSHTASTAAGNHGVPVTIGGTSYGTQSGMAPRARIAAYKGLWNSGKKYPGADYGTAVDLLAALDDAVADGVDVINYSIGPSDDFFDIWALGVLYAGKAGVFVCASAGNSGPQPVTLSHVAPWYLAVAASTHDRQYLREVSVVPAGGGDTVTVRGEGLTAAAKDGAKVAEEVEAEIVWGGEAALSQQSAWEANLCVPGVLDPAVVSGRIVVCQRGLNGRVDKGLAVVEAGGVGMVLWNDSPDQGLITDVHFLPALHVLYTDGLKIMKAINGTSSSGRPRATISAQLTSYGNKAPAVIDFSSRGPVEDPMATTSAYPQANDILKPDVAAPGVSIWAAYAPGGDPRKLSFNLLSGTSMASPHVAGIAALVRQVHPEWDPYAVKSAIQTTALPSDSHGDAIPGSPPTQPGTAFDYGSGQVNAVNVTDPGLLYPSAFEDYIQFLYYASYEKALASSGVPPPKFWLAPRDLNTPNIAVSQLKGSATVTRTLHSVATRGPQEFEVQVEAPLGVQVLVTPSHIILASGATAQFLVTFTVEEPSSTFQFGSLTWTNGHYAVRSQIAVQPLEVH